MNGWGFALFSHEAIDRCKLSNRGDERLVLERAEHPALKEPTSRSEGNDTK